MWEWFIHFILWKWWNWAWFMTLSYPLNVGLKWEPFWCPKRPATTLPQTSAGNFVPIPIRWIYGFVREKTWQQKFHSRKVIKSLSKVAMVLFFEWYVINLQESRREVVGLWSRKMANLGLQWILSILPQLDIYIMVSEVENNQWLMIGKTWNMEHANGKYDNSFVSSISMIFIGPTWNIRPGWC